MASTNITTFPGKVGISNANPTHTLAIGSNVYVDDTGSSKLTVTGIISGDGLGISNIQTANVLGLTDNVSRITTVSNDLSDNSSRITTVSSDLSDNSSRITALESGASSISGVKTFEDDIILESNLRVKGDLTYANTVNMIVSDPIIELGANNQHTNDLGLVLTRHGNSGNDSNVAIFYDESQDNLKIGYTDDGASQTTLTTTATGLDVSITGNVAAAYNADETSYFGRAAVGYMGQSDQASFSHIDKNTSANFALKQAASGATHINTPTGQHIRFSVNASEVGRFTGGGDFKVGANKLYVDTSASEVQMYSQATGSTAGPDLVLMRNNPNNGSNNEYIGQIRYEGLSDTGTSRLYAKTTGKIKTATNGSEDGVIETMIKTGGSNRISVRHSGDKFLIQKGTDLQVGEVANLYVDTSTSRVGINVASPSYTLDVGGDVNLSTGSTLRINGTPMGNWTVSGSDIYRSSGNVGVGTTSPQEKFHLYGSPIIQHETRYDVGANDGWYKIGTWDAASATGARLKISLLGAKSYSALESARGGETIIYASINNNIPTTDCNMSGSIHAYGNPIITQAKFKQVGTDRTQYEIIAYVETYTQHSMKIECSETTTFTRAWTSASDPGADSATVQAALFTHVVDNAGNVGIGTTNPQSALHVAGDSGPSNTSLALGIHMGVYSSVYPHIEIVASGSNTGWIDFKNGNTSGNGDHTDRIRGGSGHLEFITNQTERMRIDSSGNVGIGTTTAGIILDVGSSLTNPQIGRDYAVGSVHDADKRDAIYFGRWDATDREFLGMKCRVDTHTNLGYGDYSNQTKIEFYTWGNNYAASREVMCIRGDGRVGIGTNNPEAQLHIGPKDGDHIYLASVNNDYGWKIDTDDQNNGIVPFRIIKRTNDVDSTVVTIKNQDGKVGIWTTDPTEVLHVNARTTSESAFIRIQSGSGGTNPATESGIKMTESGQYGFQFVHSAVTDLLKVKHQDANGAVNQDNIMIWHPNGDVQWGKTARYNFHYNPNTWSYSTNQYGTTVNFWSVNYYFDHEGYVLLTSYGHWARKDANNSNQAGGNQAFYGWISVDNKEPIDSSLYDGFSGANSSYNKFHEYWSPDNEGAGYWRDFSHTAFYKISAGWHSFSLRVTPYFGSSHYLNINGSGLNGFYIPKHYL